MNPILNKLRSKSGASMLMALVFMMFCLFVGGAVLAAASANGYRVAHLSDQQLFLNQRSACQLLADEIDGTADVKARLTISDVDSKYIPVIVQANGSTVRDSSRPDIQDHTLTFSAPFDSENPMTAVQRVMYESAVCRYLTEKGIDPTNTSGGVRYTMNLEGFYYSGSAFGFDDFWCRNGSNFKSEGSIDIQGITGTAGVDSETFTNYTAYFTCGTGERLYDFYVDFDAFTQMIVTANAYASERQIGPITGIVNASIIDSAKNSYSGDWDATTLTKKTTISWNDAYIEKGGA